MNNIIKLCACLLLVLPGTFSVWAQDAARERTEVKAVVTTEDGSPVKGAYIHVKEGFAKTRSDRNGYFSLRVNNDATLVIEARGLQTASYRVAQIPNEIRMSAAPLFYEDESDVPIAFQTVKEGELVNQVQIIRPADNEGVVYNSSLAELVNTSVAGLVGTSNIRGLGNALVVIDGVPRYKSLGAVGLMPHEIESITFLNSVSAAVLYGTEARNGAIVITTKSGRLGTQSVTVRARYGMSVPKNKPQFLGSADYMTLYNEALVNDGLAPLYSVEDIANYRSGDNPYQYPDIDYYSSDYLKRFTNNSRIDTEFSGGGDNVTYYSNVGWARTQDFINFGPARNMSANRMSVRTNVNFRINDVISNTVIGNADFQFHKGPRANYFNSAATLRPNEYSPFIPIDMLDRDDENINALIEASQNIIDGKYLLGGSSLRTTNPFADIYAGGYNKSVDRLMEFNNIIKFDFNKFVKGLTASVNTSFDFFNFYTENVSTQYAVYQPRWEDGAITDLTKFNEDRYTGTLNIGYSTSYRRFGFSGQVNYTHSFDNGHNLDAMVLVGGRTYFGFTPNNSGIDANKLPDKFANLGLRLAYNYRNKYYVDFSSSLSNSVKLAPGRRIGFSPTVALAYNLTREEFMKDISWLDNLKITASGGVLRSDLNIGGYYLYESTYISATNYAWNEKNNANVPSVVAQHGNNRDLHMEKRKEVNVGFEAMLFNRSLRISFNYFDTKITDIVSKSDSNYPTYMTDKSPYGNLGGSDRYYGEEIGVNYLKKIGDFSLNLGIAATLWDSKVVTRNDVYAYDYLYRTGRPVSGLYMLEAEGLFNSQAEIDNSPKQLFGAVKPGDIKYKDQNDDGVIDSNDLVYVGRGSNPVNLGLNLALSYKNFTLFANGFYSSGGYSVISGSYYRMSGDDKYSVIANERWTEATKETAKYPRLTSFTATNNNQASTFWLFKNRYFNLHRVQLNYSFSPDICRKLMLGDLDVFILASNVATAGTKNAYRNRSTSSLLTRTFSIGLNATF